MQALSLKELQGAHALFEADAVGMSVEQSLAARDIPGGTAPRQVAAAIVDARERLRLVESGTETE